MKCSRCGKPTAEKHIVDNDCFCSAECAIDALTDDIITNAKERATEYYNEMVEIDKSPTRCTRCNKPLALNETAWASVDGMYCSYDCGVDDVYDKFYFDKQGSIDERRSNATRYFEEIAEEITREDYGVKVERVSEYSGELDKTFIFESVYEADELISTALIGWHYGTPDARSDNSFAGKYKATFVD